MSLDDIKYELSRKEKIVVASAFMLTGVVSAVLCYYIYSGFAIWAWETFIK